MAELNPGFLLIFGGLLIPLAPKATRPYLALVIPLAGLAHLITLGNDVPAAGVLTVMDFTFTTLRVDTLSFVFALAFLIAACINPIYGWSERDKIQQASAPIYAGAAVGATLSGDLVSFFIFWELTAVSSVFLIWASGTRAATVAGVRYLAIQLFSGVLLLEGVVLHYKATGSIAFDAIAMDHLGAWIILLAVGIKCAFPLLHSWLQDSYPKATAFGAVVLSAFTTKLAVYALARGFAGFEPLLYIGAVMTVFPVFYAVIENDLRKVLSYSLNNQVGFMVAGIGTGVALGINGAAAHAFVHIIYKALLFMSMGAVLVRVGTTKATELGGLARSMPLTTLFCLIGAASISAFPLFSGFVAKSLILSAVLKEGHWAVWLALLFASAGVLEHSGIKIPYFAFFAHDSGKRPKEAPASMLIAMAIASVICIGVGVYPALLYDLLPYQPIKYAPYTADHVVTQMQLLLFAMAAFWALTRIGIYPPEKRGVNLDVEWLDRRFAWGLVSWGRAVTIRKADGVWSFTQNSFVRPAVERVAELHGPEGRLARSWPVGFMALWTAVLLTVVLGLLYF